jgi:hypothetical protein
MLDIYPFILETITVLRPLAERIACRRGPGAPAKTRAGVDRAQRCRGSLQPRAQPTGALPHALGSARETLACLEVALALGHVGALNDELGGRFNRIIGTLVRLSGGR